MRPATHGAAALTAPEQNPEATTLVPSQRRLQRPPDFTGDRLTRFRQVFLRHGLPIALLAGLSLGVPEVRGLMLSALAGFLSAPLEYLAIGLLLGAAMIVYAYVLDRRLSAAAIGWMLYLLAVSAWEEVFFRLIVPYYGHAQGLDLRALIIASNVAFGALHYFTLRWKWPWCVAAFLGGMALSRNLDQNFDLALVIALHWVATFINTPRMPGQKLRAGGA